MPGRLRALTPAAAATIALAVVIIDVALSACDRPPAQPSARALPVTITAEGFVATGLTGRRALVTFINADSVPHDIRSDPHPDHTQCPELNLGSIPAGGSVSIFTPLESGRICGVHDETRLNDPRFRAVITIE